MRIPALGLCALLASCATTPPPPDNDRFWLETMAAHGYTQTEMAQASGKEAREIWMLREKYGIRDEAPPAGVRVLPYPGGRHPRIGFLEGAIDPHRDTKFSVFLPWERGAYVVVDFPEALWVGKDLVYLAHTHIPTFWDKQGVKLPRMDWTRREGGVLEATRTLPNGLEFHARVIPFADGAAMELRLKNGTTQKLTGLRTQNCVMLKGAPGFNAQTRDNKVKLEAEGVCAVRSEDGKRWIATVFERPRLWENPPCPCIHSDPSFPDLAPGEEATVRGRVFFYEGEDLKAEVARRVKEGNLLP